MRSESTDMEISSYIGLFDELEKIAEEQRKDITKDKFKRHLKAMAVLGLATGLGAGVGGVAKRALLKSKGRVGDLLRSYPKAARLAPVATGALGAGIAGLGRSLTKQHFDIVDKGDD
jgi:hypothetical protein